MKGKNTTVMSIQTVRKKKPTNGRVKSRYVQSYFGEHWVQDWYLTYHTEIAKDRS